MTNLGSDDTPIKGQNFGLPAGAQLDEDNGDLVIRDSGGSVVFRRDEGRGEWVLDALSADLLNTEKIDTNADDNGYVWQDVSGSRSLDTWEQAPSDRDIWFTMSVQAGSDGTEVDIVPNVNTFQSTLRLTSVRHVIDNAQKVGIGAIRVPAGQYYKVENFQDTGDYSIKNWKELR